MPVVRAGAVAAASGPCCRCCSACPARPSPWPATGTCPRALAVVRSGCPHRAELAVGLVVLVLVWVVDLRGAIGFSSLAVLAYYLLANLSARRLGPVPGGTRGWVPVAGALGCAVLAAHAAAGVGRGRFWRCWPLGAVVRVVVQRRPGRAENRRRYA